MCKEQKKEGLLEKYSRENLSGRRLKGNPRKIWIEDVEEYLKKSGW